jgi:predicted glycogen debranching enzyme
MNQIIHCDESICGNLKLALEKEWLETNGLGSYASSTIIHVNTRRYHGLLVASPDAISPRVVFLSKLEEQVLIGGDSYSLSCNIYPDAIHPTGFMYMKEFRLDPFPTFVYTLDDVTIEKKLFFVYGKNTLLTIYSIVSGASEVMLKIRPLVACRSYHGLGAETPDMQKTYTVRERSVIYQAFQDTVPIYFSHDGVMIEGTSLWYYDFDYGKEKERGFEAREDLFNPFEISYILTSKKAVFLACSLDETPIENMYELEYKERQRRALHVSEYEKNLDPAIEKDALDSAYKQLLCAAPHFIVTKNNGPDGIMAGYPWFEERLRDSLIALPGLTLVTGRFDVARNILKRYIGYLNKGELPSYFSEETSLPVYNSFESALWFFYAVYKYMRYTNDLFFVADELYDAMKQCVQYFFTNASQHVFVDTDSLLSSVNEHAQGAWGPDMAQQYHVRSRVGKLVEINALWYMAMRVLEYIAHACKEERDFFRYHDLALRIKESFVESFWNADAKCLFDCVHNGQGQVPLRPHQLLAVSLPFSLLEADKERAVLEAVERDLLTMVGVRSLSVNDETYNGLYTGDWYSRDAAYHQGCVWPWFIGFYIDAYAKINRDSQTCTDACRMLLKALFHHTMYDGAVGFVSELFDGNFPHVSRGAIAYAPAVAEVIRVYHEQILSRKFSFSQSV